MPVPYCTKHNRDMLISKFKDKITGEIQYWCPDCAQERKAQKPQQPEKTDGGLIILEELQNGFRQVNERLDKLIAFVVQKLGK